MIKHLTEVAKGPIGEPLQAVNYQDSLLSKFHTSRLQRASGTDPLGAKVPELVAACLYLDDPRDINVFGEAWSKLYNSALIVDDIVDNNFSEQFYSVSMKLFISAQNDFLAQVSNPDVVYEACEKFWNEMINAMKIEHTLSYAGSKTLLLQGSKCALANSLLFIASNYFKKTASIANAYRGIVLFCAIAQMFDDITDIEEDKLNHNVNYLNKDFTDVHSVKINLVASGTLYNMCHDALKLIDECRFIVKDSEGFVNFKLDQWHSDLVKVVSILNKENNYLSLLNMNCNGSKDFLANIINVFSKESN